MIGLHGTSTPTTSKTCSTTDQPDQLTSVDLQEEDIHSTTEVTAEEVIALPTEPVRALTGHHTFWGLQKPIGEIETRLRLMHDRSVLLPPAFEHQLSSEIQVCRQRQKDDQRRARARTLQAAQIRRNYRQAWHQAVTRNSLLSDGARDLHFVSTADFNRLETVHNTDKYFICDFQFGNPCTFFLWHIDQSGHRTDITPNEEKRALFEMVLRGKLKNGSAPKKMELKEDEFLCAVTGYAEVNAGPGDAHFNSSLVSQQLMNDRIAAAKFHAARQKICTDFESSKLHSARVNAQVHRSARKFILVDPAELQTLNNREHIGKYLILQAQRGSFTQLKLYLIALDGQRTEIPIAPEKQVAFDTAVDETVPHHNGIEGVMPDLAQLREFTFHAQDFLHIAGSIADETNFGAMYSNASLASQISIEDRFQAARYQKEWDDIRTTLRDRDGKAGKINRLLHSGTRQLNIVSTAFFTGLDGNRHADEYFLIRNESGNFTLHYITPSGTKETIPIQQGQQRFNFDEALRSIEIEHPGVNTFVLEHTDFVRIVTDNTRFIAKGDNIQDRDIADAHFSSSLHAQSMRSARIRAAQELIAKKCLHEAESREMCAIRRAWDDRRYSHAAGMQVAFLIEKYGGRAVDGTIALASGTARSIGNAGVSIGAQLARWARRIAPWLSAAGSYGWYGIRRTASMPTRTIAVFGRQVSANLAWSYRSAAPYFMHAGARIGYGVAKLYDSASRKVSGKGAAICHKLAWAGRQSALYLSERVAWSGYHLTNAWQDGGRRIARFWHDKSLIQMVRRVRAERLLFS